MSKAYHFKKRVEKIVNGVVRPRPNTALVYSLDGNKANIRIGKSSSLIRSVSIIGDPSLVKPDTEVQLIWNGERPAVLAGGASGIPELVNPRVVTDNRTIESSPNGLRVKKRGVDLSHLNFSPALQGHTHADTFSRGGWEVTENGVVFNGKTFLSPDGSITLGETPDVVRLSSEDEIYRIWVGASEPVEAPFSVNKHGEVSAKAGLIGGWGLGETEIEADSGLASLNAEVPFIQLGGASYSEGGGFWVGKDSDVYKLKIGNEDFFLDWDGESLVYQGDLRSSNFVPGYSGWRISQDGLAEFQDVVIRGTIQSSVIEQGKILAAGGSVLLSKSSSVVRDNFVAESEPFEINIKIPAGIDHSDVGNYWAEDDAVRVKSGSTEFWGTITEVADNEDYWTVTVAKSDPVEDVPVYTGEVLINYGPSGAGVIELTSDRPLIRLFSHAGSPHDSIENLLMIGNLDGYFGLTDKFGFGAGDTTLSGDYFYATDEEVKMSGEITAGSGSIGGWLIDEHALKSEDSGTRMVLDERAGLITYNGSETTPFDPSTGEGEYEILISLLDGALHVSGGGIVIEDDGYGVTLDASPTADRSLAFPDESGILATQDYVGDNSASKTQTIGVSIEVDSFSKETVVAEGEGRSFVFLPPVVDGWELTGVHARVLTGPTSGALSVQIVDNDTEDDILSTPLTIDLSETSSDTAATPPVINPSYKTMSGNGVLRIDVDSANGAVGLFVGLEFTGDR